MSKRITISHTPLSNANLFRAVPHDQVQAGDIFQGVRDPSKWYKNTEGQGCVDKGRTYYRPTSDLVSVREATTGRRMSHVSVPVRGDAAMRGGGGAGAAASSLATEAEEAGVDDGDEIPLIVISVSREGLAALKDALRGD